VIRALLYSLAPDPVVRAVVASVRPVLAAMSWGSKGKGKGQWQSGPSAGGGWQGSWSSGGYGQQQRGPWQKEPVWSDPEEKAAFEEYRRAKEEAAKEADSKKQGAAIASALDSKFELLAAALSKTSVARRARSPSPTLSEFSSATPSSKRRVGSPSLPLSSPSPSHRAQQCVQDLVPEIVSQVLAVIAPGVQQQVKGKLPHEGDLERVRREVAGKAESVPDLEAGITKIQAAMLKELLRQKVAIKPGDRAEVVVPCIVKALAKREAAANIKSFFKENDVVQERNMEKRAKQLFVMVCSM
jgi:hypothetical protein